MVTKGDEIDLKKHGRKFVSKNQQSLEKHRRKMEYKGRKNS